MMNILMIMIKQINTDSFKKLPLSAAKTGRGS